MGIKLSIFALLLVFIGSCGNQAGEIHRFASFDDAWRFYYGEPDGATDVALNDSRWKSMDLPHDWSVEFPFNREQGAVATGQTIGGTGWYRKKFALQPAQKDKVIQIYFEGAYMETEVWLNGRKVDEHPYGYTSFFCDITSYCNPVGEENVIAVKVGNQGKNSRWYSGSGIYRHVWLVTVNPVHIAPWGVFAYCDDSKDFKDLTVNVEISNESSENASLTIINELFSPNGNSVAKNSRKISVETLHATS
ncbi:MAG: beta galactosidase jelly roll domain-containing protein, partial [Dysgonamonadaceae bacterium]|nr:beta galactosidase jelly roll domain-containing protein [Dysgonamonadaceae bacterium]